MFKFREVERNIEREQERKLREDEELNNNFRKIRRESDITTEECMNYWNLLFTR